MTKDELLEFLELLFEKRLFDAAPDIHADWNGFVAYFEENILRLEAKHWNPQTGKLESLTDVRKLRSSYAGGGMRETRDALVNGVRRTFSRDVI